MSNPMGAPYPSTLANARLRLRAPALFAPGLASLRSISGRAGRSNETSATPRGSRRQPRARSRRRRACLRVGERDLAACPKRRSRDFQRARAARARGRRVKERRAHGVPPPDVGAIPLGRTLVGRLRKLGNAHRLDVERDLSEALHGVVGSSTPFAADARSRPPDERPIWWFASMSVTCMVSSRRLPDLKRVDRPVRREEDVT